MEAWVETAVLDKDKALTEIGSNLEKQYTSLTNGKIRYKQYLDCKMEDVKKLSQNLRRHAKNDRGLFHYNGHGVPKPTASGEIWVYNKNYTQYIPVSIQDLLTWCGSPTIFVWDCSAAGNIVNKVVEVAERKDAEAPEPAKEESEDPAISITPFKDTIQLGACMAHQSLPQNPDLPADLFTSCLTSPIEMALRFFILRNPLKADLDISLAFKIPGKLSERKSPLGELLWIFTSITDTIAWNVLPALVFQRLFRHDLVVAALFRGFLLAERIMRHYDCTPVSVPVIPPTHNHPMWDSWDLAVDRCLSQLPAILAQEKLRMQAIERKDPVIPPEIPFQFSRFFSDQLQAFEIWIEQGTARTTQVTLDGVTRMPKYAAGTMPSAKDGGMTRPHKLHPEQLPVVLQVLLAQAHRFRALLSLCKFLDFGPWAVQLALQIGIFPYVLKLLQAPATDLKPVLIYIWGRILGVYRSCQEDLIKSVIQTVQGQQGPRPDLPFQYFVRVLIPPKQPGRNALATSANQGLPIPNVSEHRAMCFFILSILCRDFQPGKLVCLQPNAPVMESCLTHLDDYDPLLREWAVFCLAQLWDDSADAKAKGLALLAHQKLTEMLVDDLPDVRAAVIYALGTLIGCSGSSIVTKRGQVTLSEALQNKLGMSEPATLDIELGLAMAVLKALDDSSPTVRRELVVFLSGIVAQHPANIILAAYQAAEEEKLRQQAGFGIVANTAAEERASLIDKAMRTISSADGLTETSVTDSAFKSIMFGCVYKTLLDLSGDPYPRVANLACQIVDHIHLLLLESPLGSVLASESMDERSASAGLSSHRTEGGPRRSGSVAVAIHKLSHLSGFGESATHTRGTRTEIPSPTEEAHIVVRKSISEDDLHNIRYDKLTVDEAISKLEAFTKSNKSGPNTPGMSPLLDRDASPAPESILPLRSDFYDYASRFFREPQFKVRNTLYCFAMLIVLIVQQPAEAAEPGSELYNTRLWRREKANNIIMQNASLIPKATESRWDEQIAFFNVNDASSSPTVGVSQLAFHQFEDTLLVADSTGRISYVSLSI